MTFREMNLRIFRREPVPHLLFQPRFEPWFFWTKTFGHLPARYEDKAIADVYDDVGASMRYIHYYTGNPNPVEVRHGPEVEIEEQKTDTQLRRTYRTPHGELVEHHEWTQDHTWREVGFPVRDAADLKKLAWLFRHRTYHFSAENFAVGDRYIGGRGVPQFWVPKNPYLELALQWMRLDEFIYALADETALVEEVMAAIDAAYDPLYREIVASGQVQIVNFGENVHEQHTSPAYFEKYYLPWYAKRAGQLRAAGIFTHIHIDGYFRNLLPYLAGLPFDGLESLTPKPQGDVTLEEIRAHCGDKILLDVIPAVLFLPTYPRETLMACVERIADLFAGQLILGISDELPQAAGEEGIERVRLVADWCRGRVSR